MYSHQQPPNSCTDTHSGILELAEVATTARSFDEFAQRVLPSVAAVMQANSAFLYLADSRLPNPLFFHHGFQPEATPGIEDLCAEEFFRLTGQGHPESFSVSVHHTPRMEVGLMFHPLRSHNIWIGLMGVATQEPGATTQPDLNDRLLRLLTATTNRLVEGARAERQLVRLNMYLTVSSMLAQSLDLHDLLEAALHCSMELVSAEASSVLLLDDEKKNFHFYQVEGPAKAVLMATTFPANVGIAGSVMQSRQSEVINNVEDDPRFYGKIDSESSFKTRNIIAIPLVAGEEPIGVLEVLNKANRGFFTEEDHNILLLISEEIAFAIRNAKVFEYVVNTYCKQRQGHPSCKGCKRPLGSWTPCVKYRETAV